MPATILVFDLGLTNCKVVLWNERGEIVDRARVAYPTLQPRPGWMEQRPEDWWQAALAGVAILQERCAPLLAEVMAISVTGHMHALVCLGENSQALGTAWVLGDQRSIAEAERIASDAGLESIYHLTGARLDASMPLAKLRWLSANQPDLRDRVRAFLACKDWLRHQLTGDLFTDPIDACATSLYDLRAGDWSGELVALAGIRAGQLPQIADPWQIAGVLSAEAARALGLKAGIPVVVGAGDDVEVLGNGLLEPGSSLEHLGTTGSILTVADSLVYDPLMAVEVYPHILTDRWVLGGSVTAAGSALAWARQALGCGEETPFAAPAQPDLQRPLVFIPHLAGERCPSWEPFSRGCWLGLSASHTTADLLQAVLEGIAFSLKRVLERIEALVGPQQQIRVSGIKSSDDPWLRMRASVYHRPLAILQTDEPTALGAMMLAAVGVGIYSDVPSAVQSLVRIVGLAQPREDQAAEYAELYRLYRLAEDAAREVTAQWQSSSRRINA